MIVDLLRDKDLTEETWKSINEVAKNVQDLRGVLRTDAIIPNDTGPVKFSFLSV